MLDMSKGVLYYMITFTRANAFIRTQNKCNTLGIGKHTVISHNMLDDELLDDLLSEEYASVFKNGVAVDTQEVDRTVYNYYYVLRRPYSKPNGVKDNMLLCRLKLAVFDKNGMIQHIIDLGKYIDCKAVQDRIKQYNLTDRNNTLMYLKY